MGERADRARALFLNGYNCSQAVVGAFSDLFGMEPETAMRFAEGLGGGIGRMRLTCGAVSAMALLAGLKVSTGKPGDLETRKEVYAKVREMAASFCSVPQGFEFQKCLILQVASLVQNDEWGVD